MLTHLLQALLAIGILVTPLVVSNILIEWFDRRAKSKAARRPQAAAQKRSRRTS